jgi:hypothetical protein
MGRNRQKVTGKTRAGKQRAPQNKKPAELAIAVNCRGDGRYTAVVTTHNRILRRYRKTFACSDECHAQKLAAAFALIISPDRWDCARQSTDAKFTTSIGNGIRTAMQEVWEQEQSKAKQMLAEEQEVHTSTQQIGELRITESWKRASDDFLATGKVILRATELVNKERSEQLTYLFKAILSRGRHLQFLYLEGCDVHKNEEVFKLVLKVLQCQGVWLVNLGEIQLNDSYLTQLLQALRMSTITHLYYEQNYLPGCGASYKRTNFDPILHTNRRKASRHRLCDTNHEQNWLIFQDNKSWFPPMRHSYNKEWAIANGLKTQDMMTTAQDARKDSLPNTDIGTLRPEWKAKYKGVHPIVNASSYAAMLVARGAGAVPAQQLQLQLPPAWQWREELARRTSAATS